MPNTVLKTILYAEDEEDIRDIAQIALEELGGFEVIYCCNGQEVLDKAKTQKADLVILDVMMPKMDGPTSLQELRKLPYYSETPAIFMTAKIQPDELLKYKNLGAIDIIMKPFDPMTLAEKIITIWKGHLKNES